MDDDDLLSRFESGTLSSFPHESHLRVVYLLIKRDGPDAALAAVSAGILAMARERQARGLPRDPDHRVDEDRGRCG